MLDVSTTVPPAERRETLRPSLQYLWAAAVAIFLLGVLLRVVPSAGFKGVGFDEALYRTYVHMLDAKGIGRYAELTDIYINDQSKPDTITKLPPTRFLYIFSGWLWKRAEFGAAGPLDVRKQENVDRDPALVSLHRIASLFSVLLLLVSGMAAWRMFGPKIGLGVFALIAFAPVLIHMGQHALIDGVLAFWATLCLWALWENLRRPDHAGWLTLYGASLALMVMTKENSFFVFCALCGLTVANRWAQWGTVTRRLLLVTVVGPLAGVTALITLAGGVPNFIETYRLLVAKAVNLEYAIKTGDGPWYRYLVDLLISSPIVLCLAIGGIFQLPKQRTAYLYLLGFVVFSYVIMCNVRYGMNLRYTTIWDFPLRALAFGQLALLSQHFGRRQPLVLLVSAVALCAYDLRQYVVFFSDGGLYELVTEGLLRSVQILK